MADLFVNPGLNTIQTQINLANNTGAGEVDQVILNDGTYTFNTSQAMVFDSGVTGTIFQKLRLFAANPGKVILNLNNVGFDAIYPGNAQGVSISGLILTGTPTSGGVIRDHVDSPITGWTLDNIILDAMNKSFLDRAVNPIGQSLVVKNIVTTALYNAAFIIDILGTNGDLDLYIQNIDARLHVPSALSSGIRLTDVRDVRVAIAQIFGPTSRGISIVSNDVAKGVFDVDVSYVDVDGQGIASQPAIHVGNASLLRVTRRVRLHRVTCKDINSYGFEFENGAEDCELTEYSTARTVGHGIALAEDTKNIFVMGGVVDTVVGNLNSGIALVHGRRHRIVYNLISNCYAAFRHDEAGVFTTENERNIIRDNTIGNIDYVYNVTTAAMPAGILSNSFGPNVVLTPKVAFASVDQVNKTQAEFETLFPKSITKSDTVVPNADTLFSSGSPLEKSYMGFIVNKLITSFTTAYPRKPRALKVLLNRLMDLLR